MLEEIETTRPRTYEAGRRHAFAWGLVAAVGVLLIMLGGFAIGTAFFTGVISIVFLGTLLVVGGIAEIVGAFRLRSQGFAMPFLAGVLSAIVGGVLVWQPIAGLAAVGALIGAYYLASGLFHAITAVIDRYEHWGWDLVYGALATLLGVYVLATWPISSLWLVGTLVGIELVLRGIAWIGAGVTLRRTRARVREVITATPRTA